MRLMEKRVWDAAAMIHPFDKEKNEYECGNYD